jgi:hypothetical protein
MSRLRAFMRQAIEEDEGFERELPQIAAFSASPREDVREVELASNVITPKAVSQPKPQRQVRQVRRVERPAFERPPPQRKRQGLFKRLFR